MQSVSQAWKDNQNQTLVGESFVEIALTLTDPDAYEDVTATDNGAITISNTAQTVSEVEKNIVPYATLERNMWLLNGNRKIVPVSNYGDCGFISKTFCEGDAIFPTPPVLTMSFSEVQKNLIQGVTIEWGTAYDEYATDFTITAYNGETVIGTKEVVGNTDVKSIVYMDIIDYDRITITVNKWCLAYRRARISNILPGIEITYAKKDLFSFTHKQSVDPISAELPKAEISFEIDNSDNSYNPNNAESLAKYLIEQQEIKARYGFKIDDSVEWIKCGTFYMSEWDAKQNGMKANFTARGILEFMTDTYYKGTYNPDGTSLYDLAVDVLTDASLPLLKDGSVRWFVDESLKDIYTVAPLPLDTHANCLQLIANAGGCVMFPDREGVLRIEKRVPVSTDYVINPFNSYSKPETALSKPLKQVDVKRYSYNAAETESLLYSGDMTLEGTKDILIQYSGVATDVRVIISDRGTVNSAKYYSNACVLNITGTGYLRIYVRGKALESSSVSVITESGANGETVSVDNPLITSHENAIAVGEWTADYMKKRMTVSSSWRADPRVDALDVVVNEGEFTTNNVLMTSVDFTYNGAFRGSGEGRVI